MTNAYAFPPPVRQPESDFYWEKAQARELWLRRCIDCGPAYFYPRDFCPTCGGQNVEWTRASGEGTLHAFAIVHRAPTPAFRDRVPYVAAMVDLKEGARVPANLVGIEPDLSRIAIGMPVEVDFQEVAPGVVLPVFRPAPARSDR